MLSIWVEELLISDRVAVKIIERHGISPTQVRTAIVRIEGLEFSWDFDRERGLRAIVRAKIERNLETDPEQENPTASEQDDDVLIVLYPTDNPADHAWRLGSAYYILG